MCAKRKGVSKGKERRQEEEVEEEGEESYEKFKRTRLASRPPLCVQADYSAHIFDHAGLRRAETLSRAGARTASTASKKARLSQNRLTPFACRPSLSTIGCAFSFVQRHAVLRRGCGGVGFLGGIELDSRLTDPEWRGKDSLALPFRFDQPIVFLYLITSSNFSFSSRLVFRDRQSTVSQCVSCYHSHYATF
jgi:hypothetical protein